MIQVRLHQDVYDRCYKKQARRHLHGSRAEEYIKKKFALGDVANFNLTVVVPEPSTTVILGIGGIVMLLRRRR